MQQHTSLNVCSSLSQLETRLKGKGLSSAGISPGSYQPHFKAKRLMKRQSSAPIRFQAMNKVAEPRYNLINNHLSHAKGVQTLAFVRSGYKRRILQKPVIYETFFQAVCFLFGSPHLLKTVIHSIVLI